YPINIRESSNPFNACWRTSEGRYIQTCMPDYNTYFKKFLTALGLTDMVEDERFFPVQNLHENGLGTTVYDRVMSTFEQKSHEEWAQILTEADIPFALAKTWE